MTKPTTREKMAYQTIAKMEAEIKQLRQHKTDYMEAAEQTKHALEAENSRLLGGFFQQVKDADLKLISDFVSDGDLPTKSFFMRPDAAGLANMTMHMVREVQAWRSGALSRPTCQHPNLIPLYEQGEIIDYLCADCTHRTGEPLPTFTVFVREACNQGTTFITSVQAKDMEEASRLAREECAIEWRRDGAGEDCTWDSLKVVGIAEGDVNILEWDDSE